MIQLLNTKLIALIFLVMSVGLIASCEKDEVTGSTKIELLSFGPTGTNHGDTLKFIGNNLDRVTSIIFTGTNAAVEKSEFIQQDSKLILLLVPDGAEKGYVTLKTTEGDIISKTQLNLGVTVVVSSITPEARPGANITLSGNFLNWVESISFADDKLVETFVSQSLNELVVTVPLDAQTGPLILKYGGTDSTFMETDDEVRVTLPLVTGYAVNPVKHAANVTINGTDLDLVTRLYFTGVPEAINSSEFVSQNAGQIVVEVPGAAIDGAITLEAPSGVQTISVENLNLVWPSVTTMSPNPIDPGADITITGTNLDLVTSVTFDNAPAVTSFISQSATQIKAKVPMGVLRGKITLGVLNSTVITQSADILEITGNAPPPVIAFPFYTDAVTSNWTSTGWIGGGWGGTKNYDNTSPVREGTKSIKVDYVGGWGSPFQLGGASIDLTPYTTFKISIYGGIGSGGKKVNVGVNGVDKYTITLVEGEWTDYSIPIATLTAGTTMNEIIVKEYNGSGGFTIYLDAIGLN